MRVALVALLCLASSLFASERQLLEVHFLDVGQGDAVLIQSPSGQNVLYDGGESAMDTRERLQQLGVRSVDLVVASHNHADHIGGLIDVIRYYRPRYFLDNGIPATTLTYRRLLECVSEAGTQLLAPTARRISLGDVSLFVLPPPGIDGWGQNDNSVGLIVQYGSFRLSLAGDAETRQWRWWTQGALSTVAPVHVHKASHHGSRNGDIAAAINLISPEIVVISAGRNNQFGHPAPDTERLYASHGATVFRTDVNGSVVVHAERSGRYSVRAERGEGARPPTRAGAAPPGPSMTESQRLVYVTRTGSKYHRGSCRALARSKIEMTLAAAAAEYEPCANCRPPIPRSR